MRHKQQAKAMSLLGRSSDDSLLTDVVLPGDINGRKIADLAKGIAPELEALYRFNFTENAIEHHGRLDPNVEFIAKQFTREQLA